MSAPFPLSAGHPSRTADLALARSPRSKGKPRSSSGVVHMPLIRERHPDWSDDIKERFRIRSAGIGDMRRGQAKAMIGILLARQMSPSRPRDSAKSRASVLTGG